MKKIIFLSIGLFLSILLTTIYSCHQDDANTDDIQQNTRTVQTSTKITNKLSLPTYDPNDDPPPFMCCLTGVIQGISRYYTDSVWEPCSKTGGVCWTGVTNGGKEWWLIANKPNLGKNELRFDIALLNDSTLLFKIKEYGSEDLRNFVTSFNTFTIPQDVYLDMNNTTVLVHGGEYQLYQSADPNYENFVKISASIQ